MASITTKLVELLRNLKSDAVPKPPRTEQAEVDPTTDDGPINLEPGDSPQSHKKQTDEDEDHEEIVFGDDDFVKEKKNKPHFAFKSKKNKGGGTKEPKGPSSKEKKNGIYSSVNTQATGSVYNVVNSKNVQFGSNNVYYMSATSKNSKEKENVDSDDDKEDDIPKDSCISLLMESDIEPSFKYMSFISKNLGRDWKAFYASLGYLKGYIDTLVEESGIIEARYRLLDDWAKNDKDGSLGRLATLLWEAGERRLVRELSLIYKESKK